MCDSHKPRNINIWYPDWNQTMLRYMPQLAEGPPLSSNFPKRFVSPSAGHHPNHFQTTSMEQNSVFSLRWLIFYKNQVVTLGQITISMPHFQNFLDTGFNPATTLAITEKNPQNHLLAPITACLPMMFQHSTEKPPKTSTKRHPICDVKASFKYNQPGGNLPQVALSSQFHITGPSLPGTSAPACKASRPMRCRKCPSLAVSFFPLYVATGSCWVIHGNSTSDSKQKDQKIINKFI